MNLNLNSIRPFIGAKNYNVSREFYRDLGFEEIVISGNLSLFQSEQLGFYLQDYFAKEWVENTMLFLEVKDVEQHFQSVSNLQLPTKYADVKVLPMKHESWGNVFYIIDPAGVLLHLAQFA